jgi:tetratricopeptide (TPR) repeat protein
MKMRRFLLITGLAVSFCGIRVADTLRDQLKLAAADNDELAQVEIIQRILQAEPSDRELRETLANLWISLGDYDRAEATVQDESLVSPSFRTSVLARVLYVRDARKNEAIALLADYHRRTPNDLAITRLLAEYLAATGQNQPVIHLLDEAPGVSGDAGLLLTRAEARRSEQDFEGALRDFSLAEKVDHDARDIVNQRPAFERLREAAANIKTASAILEKNPNDMSALISRTYWYLYSCFANASAVADANVALQAEPDFVSGRLLYTFAAFAAKNLTADKARENFHVDVTKPLPDWNHVEQIFNEDRVLKSQPRDVKTLAARAHDLSEAGQYSLALDDAAAALNLAPKDSAARLEKIDALARLKQFEPAAAEFRLFAAGHPPADQLAQAAGDLFDVAFSESRFPMALDYVNQAIKAHPTPQYYKKRAAVLQRLNRGAEADADIARANAEPKKSR